MRMSDLWEGAVEILGYSQPEELVFRRVTEAIERCSLMSGLDFYTGKLDICVGCDSTVALPNDVETPLAINIGGMPAMARSLWFQYSINGPGTPCGPLLDWSWQDNGNQATIQDIVNPSQIVVYSDLPEDNNAIVRIYGIRADNDLPARTLSAAKKFGNKALTVAFTQPSYSTPVTITVTLSDGFNPNEEIIIQNAATGNLNYYRVKSAPTSSTVVILQSSQENDPAGTNFSIASVIRKRVWEDGFQLPVLSGFAMPDPDVPLLKSVTRITKQVTKGYLKIIARDTGRPEGSLLAIMYPKDTESQYRRIRIAQACQWVEMRYRKKNIKITSMEDQILCDSELAILHMLRSLQFFREGNYDAEKAYQAESLELLGLTQTAKNAPTTIQVQYNDAVGLMDEWNMV